MVYRIVVIATLALISGCDRSDPVDTDTATRTSTGTTGTGTTGTGTTGTGTTGTGTTGTGTGSMGCPAPTMGPWDGGYPHPISAAGVGTTTDAYTNDAGVSALRAATVGQENAVVDMDIQDATVIAIGYLPADATAVTFWFEDSGGIMQGYFLEVGALAGDLQPGDAVSFTATEVTDYFDNLEVTAVTNFSISSTGNDVHVVDGTSGVDFSATPYNNVEVFGELTANNGECGGGKECWDMDVNGQTVIFRTGTDLVFLGDCIHWIGPLGAFDSVEQLNADNFDWYRFY
ncbi:MAG: hypothetical protein GWP91_06880 [Rhodobacterales bacterium]|nr:hypothetical protein [Rhodobacterales bacterium]